MEDDKALIEKKAMEHVRALGCDCNPEIAYVIENKVLRLSFAHDNDCTLMTESRGK